jgi:arsenate reductase
MITIYHNPKCSKSREGICFLENKNIEFETIKYIDETVTIEELQSILKKLNYKPIELVRTIKTGNYLMVKSLKQWFKTQN